MSVKVESDKAIERLCTWFGDKVAGILVIETRQFGLCDGRVWSDLIKSMQTATYIQEIPQQRR